jgi:hypothetical protein
LSFAMAFFPNFYDERTKTRNIYDIANSVPLVFWGNTPLSI